MGLASDQRLMWTRVGCNCGEMPRTAACSASIGSIAASFLIYSRLIKWLSRKVDMEKYFMPIFKKKR